jgi:uncharacterized caspase-like protein
MSVKSFSSFPACFILFVYLFLLAGCAGSVIKMPKSTPDIVREYKSVTVAAGSAGMFSRGVRVSKGDYVSILAKGTIDIWPGNPGHVFGPEGRLLIRVGKKEFVKRYYSWQHSFVASETGDIYLGYKGSPVDVYGEPNNPGFYRDDIGNYVVDMIVWRKDDPVQIADFLEKVSLSDPENKALKNFAESFKYQKRIALAERKAEKEVEEAKKAIVALQGKVTPAVKQTPDKKEVSELSKEKLQQEAKQAIQAAKEKEAIGIKDAQKEKQIAELNERLQKALQALKDLEEMKKKLAEQEEKEKVLMARLEQAERERLKLERLGPSKIPPVIAIASPKDGISVDFHYISIAGVAESGKGIAKFEILVNQQLASRKDQRDLQLVAKDLKRVDFSERIRLREGKNEISVVAYDAEGLEAKKTILIQYAKKREEVWSVVVGISKYKNIPSLKYAANDAREFYRYLTEVNGVPKDHIWLLLDEEATLDNLKSILGTQLRRQAGKDDMVIIYLAGHGATERDAASPDGDGLEKYILPSNANPKDLYASAMPMSEIARIFNRISSERLVFISDTCYSGASGGRTIPVIGTRANVSGAFLDRISQGKGRVILTASDANEVSMEKDELRHGVFTYYLLEALRGQGDIDKDGVITIDEVYRYVSMKVPQATGQDQHPVKKGEVTGQIILGVVK